MGADIHMVLEKKNADGVYVGLHNFPYPCNKKSSYEGWTARSRNYDLFADLAGVRGDGPEPKGLPDDISLLAQMKIDADGDDGHSHTYYGLKEAWPLFAAHLYGEEFLTDDRHHICYKLFGVDTEDDNLDDYRLIIWFDN